VPGRPIRREDELIWDEEAMEIQGEDETGGDDA
jgi:hypothetical protein